MLEGSDVGEIELEWKPYQLYPNLPAGGMARAEFLRARYGESADGTRTPEHIRTEADEVGIAFNYASIDRVPNTLSAHRLLAMAGEMGCQHELAETLFHAYFCDGSDVGAIDTLADCGSFLIATWVLKRPSGRSPVHLMSALSEFRATGWGARFYYRAPRRRM